MKRFLFVLLAGLISLPAYAADVAQNAVADGSGTVAGSDYLNGYSGTTSQRYTINSVLALKTSVSGNAGTATALAADPAGCAGGQVTTDINASGTASCTSWSANVLTLLGAADYAAFLSSLGAQAELTNPLIAAGTQALTASWDAGSYQIRAETFQSDVATGTAPFTIASTTRVSNLNVATAGTADTLTTARNIGDASFNGSAAITADAMLDNEDISPTAGTWDLSALTALTLPSFTGGSATPGVTFNDTDAAATGTATLSVDAVTAGQDSILQIRVDDSAGEDTVYIEVDGVAEDVEINKPLALSANSVTTTGIITGGAPTPVIDDPDNFAANFTGSNLYGGTFIANAAGTAALPNPAVGMNFTYVMEGANANIIDPLTTGTADTIYMNGLAAAQDENITSSTSGAICTFQYRSADAWMATCNGFAEASPP